MPILDTVAAAAPIVMSAANMYGQGKTNRNTRRFQERMYSATRQAALDDWNMTNEYNSPKNQMKRFKDAGLNPALIYGTGANSSNAVSVRGTDAPNGDQHAPEFDTGSFGKAIEMYNGSLQRSILQQNLKNEEERNYNIQADTAVKLADAATKGQDVETGAMRLEALKEADNDSRAYGGQGFLTTNIKTEQDLKSAQLWHQQQTNEMMKKFQDADISIKTEMVNKLKQEIQNLSQQYNINEFEEYLNSIGTSKHDGVIFRNLIEMREKLGRLIGVKTNKFGGLKKK